MNENRVFLKLHFEIKEKFRKHFEILNGIINLRAALQRERKLTWKEKIR